MDRGGSVERGEGPAPVRLRFGARCCEEGGYGVLGYSRKRTRLRSDGGDLRSMDGTSDVTEDIAR
jgi:hypothetical protein